MYNTGAELLKTAEANGISLGEAAALDEIALGATKQQIDERMWQRYEVMMGSATKALDKKLKTAGGLIEGIAMRHANYNANGNTIGGAFFNNIMAMAFSSSEVNAAMGKICAAPTAGACGIMPAVIINVAQQCNASKPLIIDALLTATAVGALYTRNATVAGAQGGCQAECGVAGSMAAAGACRLYGGTPSQCLDAASFAMINVMGLVCDPVAGLVQFPCAQRNASGAIGAVCAADMALAGQKCLIPFDEVVDAMYKVGKSMPYQLRETALGGIAATPAGKELEHKIFG